MNEIEKMYSNAGIEKEFEKPAKCANNPYITCDGCMLYDDKKGKCNNRKDYPPFTAEKQIELIKWLASSRKGILISDMGEDMGESEFNISTGFYYCAKHIQNFRKNKDLSVVIADFVNCLWQDLTEEERTQIKEILE